MSPVQSQPWSPPNEDSEAYGAMKPLSWRVVDANERIECVVRLMSNRLVKYESVLLWL